MAEQGSEYPQGNERYPAHTKTAKRMGDAPVRRRTRLGTSASEQAYVSGSMMGRSPYKAVCFGDVSLHRLSIFGILLQPSLAFKAGRNVEQAHPYRQQGTP